MTTAEELAKTCAQWVLPIEWLEKNNISQDKQTTVQALILSAIPIKELLEVARAARKEMDEHKTHHVDWAKINSLSPDYDPNYNPDYPDSIIELQQAFKALQQRGIEL